MASGNEAVEIKVAVVAATAFVTLVLAFLIYFIFQFRKRQMQHHREKEQMKLQFESDVMRAQLEISEETLKKISAEIHDNIGQSLTLAKLQFKTATKENFEEHFHAGNEMVSRALSDLRNLSRSLSGNFILENGLVRSIQRELEIVQESGEITCTLVHEGEHPQLSSQEEIILFRCVQEALNNAVKHSEGNKISVLVLNSDEHLLIEISDNGKGIDKNSVEGLGMKNLRQRITLLGGTMNVNPSSSKGTRVKFILPNTKAEST